MTAALWERLLENPPPPDAVFTCGVCGTGLRGRTATFDENCRVTCADCTGRLPEEGEND